MKKINCWEFMKCGREPGGANVKDHGLCPAAAEVCAEGLNCGRCGGRACWAIAGTCCGKEVEGTYAKQKGNCIHCEFFKNVVAEEGEKYHTSLEIWKRLKKERGKSKE
ncbi:MAG: hypothetical protein NTZ78_04225 [Candidatus Aureabacteria bacterium]|nr:hypothetical protein [Candidatus Auribacterota bacterium]